MKPLFHPSITDITVEGILHALADPVRVQIFAEMARAACPQACNHFIKLSDHRELPKSSLSQHLKVLRDAGLIHSERKGIEMHNTTRFDDLSQRFGPLITAIIDAYWAQQDRLHGR